jgi:hypothetical protein
MLKAALNHAFDEGHVSKLPHKVVLAKTPPDL